MKNTGKPRPDKASPPRGHQIRIGSRVIVLPASRAWRIAIGVLFIVAGLLGFLPIVGFWMVPLGLFVLSIDLPWARRGRRRFSVWFTRRFPALAARLNLGNSQSTLHRPGDSS